MAARRKRRRKAEAGSTGLSPAEVAQGSPPREIRDLEEQVAGAGGAVLGRYREPLNGHWLVLAALPLTEVVPTPFQRDVSEAHVKRLEGVIHDVGLFLDPVIAVPIPPDQRPAGGAPRFWTPNGNHRLQALHRLGARTLTALVSPEAALAYRILALNTEKAHNLRERALEAIRMARGLAEIDPRRHETDYALELEEGALVTFGIAYEERPRFAAGAYAPAIRPSDPLLELGLAKALERRAGFAKRLLGLDERVSEIMEALKQRGFESPYLRNFIVSRIRPFRPPDKPAPEFEPLLEHMEKAAAKFDPAKIREDQVARTGGAGGEE